jgi:hypothetical protein
MWLGGSYQLSMVPTEHLVWGVPAQAVEDLFSSACSCLVVASQRGPSETTLGMGERTDLPREKRLQHSSHCPRAPRTAAEPTHGS